MMNIKPIDLNQAEYLYRDQGLSINQVAKELHVSPNTISKQMHESGIITKRADVQRMKCPCGNIYVHYEEILGLPKCPRCWITAHFSTPLPRRNKKPRVYKSIIAQKNANSLKRNAELGLRDHGYHPDNGCSVARMVLGENTTCLSCKFEKCLCDFSTRQHRALVGVVDESGEIKETVEVTLCHSLS